MKRPSIIIIAGLLLSALATVIGKERAMGTRLRLELANLQRMADRRTELEADNNRLKTAIGHADSLKNLQTRRRRIEAANFSADQLRLKEHDLRRALGLPTDPVWMPGAEILPADKWKFAGQSTPADALESVLWAARGGDVDHLASLIGFDPKAKVAAQALFAELPPATQTQYGSPEKVVAALIAAQMPDDYAAVASLPLGETAGENAAFLNVRLQDGTGAQSNLIFEFQHDQSQWRLAVPAAVVQRYASQLQTSNTPK